MAYGILHVLAASLVLIFSLSNWQLIFMFVPLSVSVYLTVKGYQSLSNVEQIVFDSEQFYVVIHGIKHRAELRNNSIVSYWLIALPFDYQITDSAIKKKVGLILLSDSASESELRQLRIRLKSLR